MHPSSQRWFAALFLLVAGGLCAQASATETLARLDSHLDRIRQEVKFGRELTGGLLIGLGAVVGVGGLAVAQTQLAGPADTEIRNAVLVGTLGVAGVYAGSGILVLVLKGDFETVPERFAASPSDTDEQRLRKIAQGEVGLQSLSDKARFNRLLSSGLVGVMGGAVLASGYAGDTTSGSLYTGLTYLGFALVNLFLESTPERENKAYAAWKSGSR